MIPRDEMLKFDLPRREGKALKALLIGAHSDDIEIGCGGTVLRLLSENENVEIYWLVLGTNAKRRKEALNSAKLFLAKARSKNIITKSFKDGYLPYYGSNVKKYFESVKKLVSPDIIFTHYRYDLHQDHRLISDLTWNTYRNNFILEYELIKYDGDMGSPNYFVWLDQMICKEKVDIIMKTFQSQSKKDWFTEDAFMSIMRIRGIESKAPAGYAEAFYCRKIII